MKKKGHFIANVKWKLDRNWLSSSWMYYYHQRVAKITGVCISIMKENYFFNGKRLIFNHSTKVSIPLNSRWKKKRISVFIFERSISTQPEIFESLRAHMLCFIFVRNWINLYRSLIAQQSRFVLSPPPPFERECT
jgi:hypothetical protein